MRPGESLERGEWNPATVDGHEAEEAFRQALADEVTTELEADARAERTQDELLKLLEDPDA